jgi:YtkA-like
MSTAFRWRGLVLLGALASFACDKGDDEGDDGHSHDTGETATDSHDTGETATDSHDTGETATDTEASDCAAETRDDEFSIGLSKSGTAVQATFVSADPAPPIKGDNTWVIDFADLEGQPLADLGIVAIPMMPDHGHGTPVSAVVTALDTPGQYEITPVNLFMSGYWEITFELTLAGGEQDSLMFGFCVE